MSKIIKHDTIEVKKVGKDAITYKITAPDLSNLFSDMKAGNVTEENIDSFMDDYISDAKMVTNEVDVSYTYENEKFSAEYGTEEFINASGKSNFSQCIDRKYGYSVSGTDSGCAE